MRDGLMHEAGDISELTRHLARLDADRGLLSRLSAATLGTAQTLTWAESARRLNATYATVLARAAGED
jgi:hypothetical protein